MLIHECKTCVALRHLKDEGVFGPDVKYQVKTTKPYFSYSAILYKRWDVIFVGLNSYGCGNNNEATFIHEMRYLSKELFQSQPIFILVADQKHRYTCTTRNVIKYLDVDGIINFGQASSKMHDFEDGILSPPYIDLDIEDRNKNSALSAFVESFFNTEKSAGSEAFRVWRPRLGIVHFRTKTTPWEAFEVGFTSAIRTLEEFYIVTWINVDDWQGLKIEDVNVSKFDSEYDLLFVKSNWHWTVDTFVRKYMRNVKTPICLLISGVATPPEPFDHSGDELSTNKFDEIQFYNLLFYETEWYRPKIAGRHRIIQRAFGIDTNIMRDMNVSQKTIDSLFIGWMANYKRPWLFAKHLTDAPEYRNGGYNARSKYNIVAIGKHDGMPEGPEIVEELRRRDITVLNEVSYFELAKWINQAKEVHIPSTELGGGERAILESKACGVPSIRIENDNLKLKELLDGPVLSHITYAGMLHKGISKLYVLGITAKSTVRIIKLGMEPKVMSKEPGTQYVVAITLALKHYNVNNMDYLGLGENGQICCHVNHKDHIEAHYRHTKCFHSTSHLKIHRSDGSEHIAELELPVVDEYDHQLNISCSLRSSFYDMDYAKSNWMLLDPKQSNEKDVGASNIGVDDTVVKKAVGGKGPRTQNIENRRNFLIIYDRFEYTMGAEELTIYVHKLYVRLKSFLYNVYMYDINGKIANPQSHPQINMNSCQLNVDIESLDMIIGVGKFGGSSDYFIAFLHHMVQTKTIVKSFIHLDHGVSWQGLKAKDYWKRETYSLVICTLNDCLNENFLNQHQNVVAWHSPALIQEIEAMLRNDVHQLTSMNIFDVGLYNTTIPTCLTERSQRSRMHHIKNGDWSIGIYRGKTLTSLKPIEHYLINRSSVSSTCPNDLIFNPVIHSDHIKDIPSIFVADPFIVKRKGSTELYIFFESLDYAFRGFIGVAVSLDDGFTWKYLGSVLEESFHLSFPYVFYDRISEKYYMIPESHRDKSVRLYETDIDTFPFGWKLSKELLAGEFFQDTGIVYHDGIWYLFTTTKIQPKEWRQDLYFAKNLKGEYQKHPASPISPPHQGCKKGRLGGRLLSIASAQPHSDALGELIGTEDAHAGIIRFSQGAEPYYGNSLYANLIVKLTPKVYEEKAFFETSQLLKEPA